VNSDQNLGIFSHILQCDETKPHCQRCQRGQRVCPGYRDQNALVFRTETGPQVRRSPSTKALVSTSSNSLPASMSTDWFQCAVSYFFRNYVLAPTNGFPGYYPFLPQLYESNPKAGYFRNSVEAIALATFARVKDMSPSYFSRSRQSYGLAVSQLRSVLNNPSEAYSSAPVAAVVLLWKYDVCSEQYYISLEPR